MSYTVQYRVEISDGEVSVALFIAKRVADTINATRGCAILVSKDREHSRQFATTVPEAYVRMTEPDGFLLTSEFNVRVDVVNEAVLQALADVSGEDGFYLAFEGGRFWHDAWLGGISISYHIENVGHDYGDICGLGLSHKLDVQLQAVLDHWPETEARRVFANVVGRSLQRIK